MFNTFVHVTLSAEEREAFEKVDEILAEMYEKFSESSHLVNIEAGDLIEINEIPRIRGALSCIADARVMELF